MMAPINISIYCDSSPRNMPPKIKLANVNFATSSNDFPIFSLMFGFPMLRANSNTFALYTARGFVLL